MAGIQRSWRRTWGRDKPVWQRMAPINIRRGLKNTRGKVVTDISSKRKNLVKQVAASVAVLQLLSNIGLGSAYASNITIDNRTATQVDVSGNITNIHTNTFSSSGKNAFNSFRDFSVSNGDIVNLHFSNLSNTMTADNLLNYVTGGSASNIDGMLNGIKNGQIGGNVYLLNPSGIMVGSTGIVNVGSLTLSTTKSPFGNQLDPEKPIESILAGLPGGDITIQGKVNTVTGTTLLGNKVTNSGVIQTGAAYAHDSSVVDFSDIVNTNDLQYGTKLAVENGNIVISAHDSFENLGTISAHSNSGSDVVKITAPSVTLGGNILTGGASLEVKAVDSIKVENALLSTRQVAEDSTLENIKNGTAIGIGKAGNVSLAVNHTTYKDKADININKSVIEASGTGSADTGGDVSIVASSQDKLFAWAMTGPDAAVTVKEATIKGNNISIQAIANNNAADSPTFDELDDVNDTKNNDSLEDLKNSGSSIGDTLVSTLGNLRVGVSVSNVHAKAEVTIDDKARLVADKDVQVSTAATSAVESMLFSVVGGAGVAISDAQALTTIKSGAEIIAGNDVDVSAATKNTINMSTKAIPVVAGLTPLNMLVTYADMKSNASAVTEAGSSVDAGGALNVTAGSVKDMTVSASASAAGGYFSAGVAINKSDVNATAEIAGDVNAGKVAVDAKVDTLQNNTWSEASVGDGEPGSGLDLAVDWISNSFGVWVKDKLGLGKPPKKVPPSVGITGAIAVTLSDDNATAKITSTGTNAVKSEGDISVTSEVTDVIRTAAIAQQKQREENNVLNHPTDANKKAAGVSAAVIYGQYNNTADAYIGDNAIVDAKQKLTIDSSVNIPFQNNWKDFDKLTTNLTNAFLSSNLGLDKAMFTSWAQASSNGDKGTGSASVDIMNFTNNSNAYIGKGALINQDKTFNSDHTKNDVSVTAKTNITTLDLAGMLKTPLDDLIQAARDKTDPMLSAFGNTSGGTGVGGSVLVTLEDNTTKAYIDKGAKVEANDLKVDADTTVKNISIGAAGGKAADAGFNGTATANIINNTTYAQVIDANNVTAASDIAIDAADNIYNIDAAGGVTESSSVGVGVSIAYNNISRDTKASVSGNIIAGDSLNVNAENTGGIATVSLAGSVTADKPPEPKPNEEDKDPVEYIRYLFADEDKDDAADPLTKVESKLSDLPVKDASGNKPKSGISAAGNVSINITDEKAVAFVGDNSETPVATNVTAKTSKIEAKNDSGVYALSGAVAIAANADPNSKGLAGAFMLNKVNETTEAYVKNASLEVTGTDAGDGLALKATNDADIVSVAASGGVAPSGKAIAGQVSLNMIDNTTSAYADNSSITTANDMTVSAEDGADITAVGGAVAYGGSAGFGASIAVNLMDNTTEAYVNNSNVVGTNNESDISVTAEEDSAITSVTAAVGASRGSMAGAFSASGNALTNTTKAYIAGGKAESAAADTKGSVAVIADDTAAVTSIAGAGAVAAGGSGVGVGASTSVLVTDNIVSAAIGDNTKINALGNDAGILIDGKTNAGLTVAAKSEEEIVTIAAGGAGGGNAGIAGSATVNVLNQQSKASIGKTAAINAVNTGAGDGQNVIVNAANVTDMTGLAGALAIGKTAGVGAGITTAIITNNTEAYLDSGADVKAENNVIVAASSQENINSFAGGAAGGGDAGIAGAAGVEVVNITTNAHIGNDSDTSSNKAKVSAEGSVVVSAQDDINLNLAAGTAAYGGTAGIGASIGAGVLTQTTQAYIANNAEVQANAAKDAVNVNDGNFNTTYSDYLGVAGEIKTPELSSSDQYLSKVEDISLLTKQREVTRSVAPVKGVAVTATSTDNIKKTAAGGAASGTAAVQGSAGVDVVTATTKAYIGDTAKVNQDNNAGTGDDQSVMVAAGNDTYHLGIAQAAAVSGSVGVGPGADVNVFNNTTKASIGKSALISAKRDITVAAAANESILSAAAALAAGADVGVAGSVAVNYLNTDTEAYIDENANVRAGNNVGVTAKDDTTVDVIAGSAGLGLSVAGVGGSISVNVLDKTTHAYVASGASVDADGTGSTTHSVSQIDANNNKTSSNEKGLAIQAVSTERLFDVTASGAGGLYAGVAGAAAINLVTNDTSAYIGNNARINADKALQTGAAADQAVHVAALDDLKVTSVGGSVAGGAAGVSGGVDIGVINTNTTAYVGNGTTLNAKGEVAVDAYANKDITSNAASVSGGAVGVAGGVSVYVVGTKAPDEALSKLNSQADRQGNTNVQGYVDNQVHSERITNALSGYQDTHAKGASDSLAASINGTTRVTDSLSAAGTAVPAGTSAFIGDDVKINKVYSDNSAIIAPSGNGISVKAVDKLSYLATETSLAAGGDAAGGAISVAVLKNVANAHVGKSTALSTDGDLVVNADVNQQVKTVNAGMAVGSGDNGLAANLSIKVLTSDADAYIDAGSLAAKTIIDANDITVKAQNDTTVTGVAGTAGIGGNAGVGASLDVAVITKEAEAYISGQTDIDSTGDIRVQADSADDLKSVVAGFAGGGSAGIAGAVSGYSLGSVTKAHIDSGASVLANGSLWLDADSSTSLNMLPGTAAVGGGAGVGAGIGIAAVDKTTEAYIGTKNTVNGITTIDASDTSVTALGKTDSLTVDDGSFAVSYTDYIGADKNPVDVSDGNKALGSSALTKKRTATKATTTLNGIAVTATNKDDISTFTIGGAVSGGLAAAMSGGVNVINNTTNAAIGDYAKINQDNNSGADTRQSVRVAAGNDLNHLAIAGSVAGSGGVGIGAGADVTVVTDRTNASLGDAARVTAMNDVSVLAQDAQQLISTAANAALAGTVAVAGSVSVIALDTSTQALMGDNSVVKAGDNVLVRAADETGTDMIAGTAAIGKGGAGVGGSVAVTSITKDIDANVGDGVTVDALAGISVEAQAKETVFTAAAAGAGGYFAGIAGAVSVESLDVDTHAGIGADAQVNTIEGKGSTAGANQDVAVMAADTVKVSTFDGSLGIGGVGAAGGVDVGVIKSNTSADIGAGATVNAKRDITVAASAEKTVKSTALSAAGGLGAIAGGVSVYSIGNGLDHDAADRLNTSNGTVGNYADQQISDGSVANLTAKSNSSALAGITNAIAKKQSNLSIGSSLSQSAQTRGTAAGIGAGAKVTAGRDVAINAMDKINLAINAGAGAAGVVGLGAGVGIATISDTVNAYVDSAVAGNGATLAAADTDPAGTVVVKAIMDENAVDKAYVGSGGIVAVDAAVAVLKDTSQVSAIVGDKANIAKAESFTVTTDDKRNLTAATFGVGAGVVSAGASVATTYIGGSDTAYLGDEVNVGSIASQPDLINIKANALLNANSEAEAVKGGIGLAASGAAANAEVGTSVDAHTGTANKLYAANTVTVSAESTPQAMAKAKGINVAKGAAVGVSAATAKVYWPSAGSNSPTVNAALGADSTVTSAALTVSSRHNIPGTGLSASAEATGAAGALLVGANATHAGAYDGSVVTGVIGENSTLTISGATSLTAENNSSQQADAKSYGYGIIAAGANHAEAKSQAYTTAKLGKEANVNSTTVDISAKSSDKNIASAVTGTGGVIAGSAAVVNTSAGGITKAYIDDSAKVAARTLTVNATHTALFNAKADSTYASALGASGVVVNHTVDTDVLVDIGQLTDIKTDRDVNLRAENISRKDWLGAGNGDDAAWNISAAGGGAISGAAVVERVNITHDTAVTLGTGASITAGTDTSEGSFAADAISDMTVHDKARINTGGAISAAVVDSRINAKANTKVTIGDTAQLYSKSGTIKAGTKGSTDLDNRVAVDVYGAAGAPAGTAYSNYTGDNTIAIKPNAGLVTDDDDIVLAAGQDTAGNAGTIKANATVNLWNKTVFPINSKPNPQANVVSNSTVDIQAGSNVGSAQDVYLTADKGNISATYTGVGKDLYREALAEIGSAVSELFGGGEVNLDIKGGSRSVSGAANVAVNGKVETGINRVHELTFGGSYQEYTNAEGIKSWRWIVDPATSAGEGKTHTTEHSKAITESMTDRLNELYKLKAAYAGDAKATGAYDAEILFLQEKMVAMGLASWNTIDGKKAFVPGLSAGTGALSPKAAAQASLTEMQGYQTAVDSAIERQRPITDTAKAYRDLVQARELANSNLTGYINDTTNFTAVQRPSDRADAVSKKSHLTEGNPLIAKYQQAIDYYDALAEAKAEITQTNSNWNSDIDFATVQAAYEAENGKLATLTDHQSKLTVSIANLDALLKLPSSDPNALSDKTPTGPTADFITVKPITAKLGDIKVKADNLTGSGTLFAPGDAKITITNNSPAFLTVNNLIVRDGGSILFNGASVKNNAAINALNTGKSGAKFDVTTKADTDKPAITITSTFDPNAPANKKPLYNAKGESQGSVALGVAPDITLAQGSMISNVNGPVKIESAYGSIYANGSINAGTVDIKANNGDFVQSYVDGFNHVGGDPEKLYNEREVEDGLRPGGITANGNIFISARYLNVNGLIKSGVADWDLELGNDVKVLVNGQAKTLAEAQADYRDNGGNGFYKLVHDPVSGYPGNIAEAGYVSYDAGNDRFEISGVEVHGGYVQLYGQIINTAWDGESTGKVQALDGYGKITITNNSGKDIVLNNLNTGEGTAGIIDITDIQNSAGTAIHTRYTSTRGEVKVERNGEVVDPNIISTENDRSTLRYNPRSGLYYNWTTGQDYSFTQKYHFESDDVFGYTYKSGTTPKGSPTTSNPGVPTPLADGIYLSDGRPFDASGNPYYAHNTKTINMGPGQYHLIKEWTTRDWYSFGITGTYHQNYSITTPKKDITTYTVKADNPIGIGFFGYDKGDVEVSGTNTGNVLLKGAISNKEGVTSIAATKDILQADSSALITTDTLNLGADGNIGSSTQGVRAIISDTLNAASAAGDVNITQVLGNLSLGIVTADAGTLRLIADGSIANAAISDVRGQRVELTSNNGSIGDASTPLNIKTGTTDKYLDGDYGLKASALNDVNIANEVWEGKNAAGNLLIDTVESKTGDVKITTPGQMIDNNTEQQIDTRTWEQLTDYWDSLQLRAGEDSNAEKQAQTVASYVNGKNADYQTYWQLKDHIVNGQYICTEAEKAALSSQNITPGDFAASQTAKYSQLEAQGVGVWNNGEYNADFAYVVTKTERDSLLKGSSWTDRELAISLAPGALKQLTDTNPVIKAPNVKGKNITLTAGKGIGSNLTLPTIDAKLTPDKLTPEQKVALAAAERADLVLDNVNKVITVTQRKPVNIETTGGVLNAAAGEFAYLGSEKTVLLDQITAAADIRLKVGGSILNGDVGNANIIGQNVILEAADGTIGTEAAFLQLSQDGTLTARAADNIFLRKDGDIKLDTLYSLGDINLETAGSVQSDYDDKITIMSKSLKLKAKQIGSNAKALGISLAEEGALTAEAENDISINNISSKLNISQAKSSAGNIDISADKDMSANNVETTTGSIKLNATKNLESNYIKAPGVTNLISGQDMEAANIESTIKGVDLTAGGNLTVDAVKAATDIVVKAGGDILNGASDFSDTNLTAQNINLTAQSGDIGQTDKPVTISATGTVTAAAQNNINLSSSGDFNADMISNRAGSINLAVINGSSLHIAETSVADGMNLRSDKVALDHVVHTGNSMLQMDISGSSKPMAENVTINVLSAQGVEFNNLIADRAVIKAQTDKLAAIHTVTGTKAEFTNNYYTVAADNNPPQTLLGSDVLLRPLDTPYDLLIDGKDISTNTEVINSLGGIRINGSATSDTAVTIADKTLKTASHTGMPDFVSAGSSSLSGSGLFPGNLTPASLVDTSQLNNFPNADGTLFNQDQNQDETPS